MTQLVSRREEVIARLLDRYTELVDPLNGPASVRGDGDSVVGMPRTYTPSVRELERLMVRMRQEARSIWWHTNAYYIACQWVTKDRPVKRKGKSGKTVTVMERQAVRVHDSGVRLEKVRRGVSWLASEWSLPVEPMLPVELLEVAA